MKRKALITGICGQDGSYLAETLLEKGYEVHGIVRRVGVENRFDRVNHILDQLHIHSGSMENYGSIWRTLALVKPDEIYHLAAQSYVGYSFEDELSTVEINSTGTHFMLNAMKELIPECRFYFAGSSEMFGKVLETPQKETTPFYPRSSYGISKVSGFNFTRLYREAYSIYGCSGILFNHESPRRGQEFVTRKITLALARIKYGLQDELRLGNLSAKRDWSHSKDMVEAMWLMLQQDKPDDYVVGSGETHTVGEFLEIASEIAGISYLNHLVIDPRFYRPAEVELLLSDPSRAKEKLGWKPKYSFRDLVEEMVERDLEYVKNTM